MRRYNSIRRLARAKALSWSLFSNVRFQHETSKYPRRVSAKAYLDKDRFRVRAARTEKCGFRINRLKIGDAPLAAET